MIDVVIRPARPEDRPALEYAFAELQAFERTIEPNRADPRSISGPYLDDLFAECAKASGAILVAERSGRLIGFVSVLPRVTSDDIIELEQEYGYVADLVVLEPHRGTGIGTGLMRAAEAHAFEAGASRLRVGVLAGNARALRLYQHLGFQPQEVVLEKQLRGNSSPEPAEAGVVPR